jgi:hypothetical protein
VWGEKQRKDDLNANRKTSFGQKRRCDKKLENAEETK